MIHQIVKGISNELERLAQYNIPVERALDLIEASTENLEELVVINTMRESLQELDLSPKNQVLPHPAFMAWNKSDNLVYQS
ncbi:MAG: hypothetical protein MJE63_31135 [Proteobacteria bacterium]|nr:hypothetical protein [Pseudomonadota bacterium]